MATDWPLKPLSDHCYLCMVDPTRRRTGKNTPQIVLPDIPSSIAPVPHCPELPILTLPKRDQPSSGDSSKSDSEEDIGDPNYGFKDAFEERRPYFPNQKDINDLISDLGLTKSNAWASDIQAQALKLVGWKRTSHRSEKASTNIFQLLQSSRWAVLLQQCGRSIRGYRYHL